MLTSDVLLYMRFLIKKPNFKGHFQTESKFKLDMKRWDWVKYGTTKVAHRKLFNLKAK